jgi:hypothetical protein
MHIFFGTDHFCTFFESKLLWLLSKGANFLPDKKFLAKSTEKGPTLLMPLDMSSATAFT